MKQDISGVQTAVEQAVFQGISDWTGMEIHPGDAIPLASGDMWRSTILTEGQIVDSVLEAADLQSKSDLKDSITALERLNIKIGEMIDAWEALPAQERVALRFPLSAATMERRVILALGLEVAFTDTAPLVSMAIKARSADRKAALKDVNAHTAGTGRTRNEAAYRVAETIAHLFIRLKGERPTFAENENGQHGAFSPVLRHVFDALGWQKTSIKRPAEVAIRNISDAEIAEAKVPRKNLFWH